MRGLQVRQDTKKMTLEINAVFLTINAQSAPG